MRHLLVAPRLLPGSHLLAQETKRGGVAGQLPQHVGQDLRDDLREVGLHGQAAVGVEQLLGVRQWNGPGQREHPCSCSAVTPPLNVSE